jgi:hypothetical protein
MPHNLNLHNPRLLLQQNRPLGIPRKTPIGKSPGLLDPEPSMSGERDPENVAELFQTEALGLGNNTLISMCQ